MKTTVMLLLCLGSMVVVGCNSATVTPERSNVAAAQQDGAVVIDVRTPEEYSRGHLENAINVPVDTIQSRIEEVVPNKSTPILVHCQSGRRAQIAKEILEAKGFRVQNLGSFADAKTALEN